MDFQKNNIFLVILKGNLIGLRLSRGDDIIFINRLSVTNVIKQCFLAHDESIMVIFELILSFIEIYFLFFLC